jgi:hypothetical protein
MYLFKSSINIFRGEMSGRRAGTKQRPPHERAILDFLGKEFRAGFEEGWSIALRPQNYGIFSSKTLKDQALKEKFTVSCVKKYK